MIFVRKVEKCTLLIKLGLVKLRGQEEGKGWWCQSSLGMNDRDRSGGATASLSRVRCMKLALNLTVRGV